MEIALHEIEPWLIKYQFAPYNLAESGMVNQTVGELLSTAGGSLEELSKLSFANADTHGSRELREAIAAVYQGVDPDDLLVTTGTSEGLLLYYLVRQRPGANVVVPTPAFQSLPELPHYLGYELRTLPLRKEDGFRPDLAKLEKLVDDHTTTIVVNNPQNPTGILFTEAELAKIRAIAKKHGAEILADEHYRFVPYGKDELVPSIYRKGEGVVEVGSMIKCFGCVGLRVGWIIADKALIAACRNLKDYTTHTVSPVSDYLATVALRGWRKVMPRYRQWAVKNVAAFSDFMGRHSNLLGWTPPEAGLVSFPYLKDPSLTSSEFSLKLVEKTGVFVLPGETFGSPGHFRVGFGLEPAQFAKALELWSGFIETRGFR